MQVCRLFRDFELMDPYFYRSYNLPSSLRTQYFSCCHALSTYTFRLPFLIIRFYAKLTCKYRDKKNLVFDNNLMENKYEQRDEI